MALTGDLAQLHIADIIQLIHTTRKSGTLTVTGDKGESRIIFSNGYLVGASHLSNRIRIGTVLVKMQVITPEDLKRALDIQKKAGKSREPLLRTLLQMGKVTGDAAFKGLKKLIEGELGGIFTPDIHCQSGGQFVPGDAPAWRIRHCVGIDPFCQDRPADRFFILFLALSIAPTNACPVSKS